jgi:hypothetical protein
MKRLLAPVTTLSDALTTALILVVIMVALLHQDFWLWTDKRLVLGFLPIGLAYHIGYSFLAALTMGLLVRFAWPTQLETDVQEETHSP